MRGREITQGGDDKTLAREEDVLGTFGGKRVEGPAFAWLPLFQLIVIVRISRFLY